MRHLHCIQNGIRSLSLCSIGGGLSRINLNGVHILPKWREKNQSQIPIHVDDDLGTERPIGRDAAKESARRNGKRKTEEIIEDFAILGGNIDKIVAVTQRAQAGA